MNLKELKTDREKHNPAWSMKFRDKNKRVMMILSLFSQKKGGKSSQNLSSLHQSAHAQRPWFL